MNPAIVNKLRVIYARNCAVGMQNYSSGRTLPGLRCSDKLRAQNDARSETEAFHG